MKYLIKKKKLSRICDIRDKRFLNRVLGRGCDLNTTLLKLLKFYFPNWEDKNILFE